MSLTGGTIRDGSLTGAIELTGGTVNGIGDAASLTTTARTTTLQGTNTYTGATNVNGGTLMGGAANAFSAVSATTVDAGGALDLGGFRQTVSSLAGAGTVTNSGTSDAVLTNQGPSSTFSGSITDGATNTTGLTENSAGNTLTLSGTNAYSGPTTVEAGSSILATGTLNLTTTNSAVAAIVLQGNGASILATGGGTIASAGDAIEFLGGTSQTATFDNFDISTQSGNIVFADPAMATITFNNSTVNAGTGYLLDATAGSTVNFNASASTLTGAMATDAVSTSNVNLTNGTVWNLTGPSNVSSLAVTNSAIIFAPPGPGGFKTLTVGNYVGSGANITLNTALGGSSSPTDQIVVNGGTATGLTYLTIRNAGGSAPRRPAAASRSSSRPTAGQRRPTPSPSPIRRSSSGLPVLARRPRRRLVPRIPADPHAAAGPVLGQRRREGAARPDRQQRLAELHPARRNAAGQLLKLRVRLRGPRLFRLGNAGPR